MEQIRSTMLRQRVERQLNLQWTEWSASHPNLAAAIDRTRLIETTVQRIRDDMAFREAMRNADLDEAKLAAAERLLAELDRAVRRALPV